MVVVEQVGVDEHAQVGGVAERGDAADREAGGLARTASASTRLHFAPPAAAASFFSASWFLPLNVGEHDLAVDAEDQALDDLADLDADRRRRVLRGLGALRELARLDRQAALRAGVDHSLDVGVHRRGRHADDRPSGQ